MSSAQLVIRPAGFDDVETIVEFNIRLADESEDTALDAATLRDGVRRLFEDDSRGRYFVAMRDNRIIGQIMLTYEWSDWRNGQIWWIQSVYVHPDFRKQGVLRALYGHVERTARANPDVVGLRLYVEEENERAQEAYRKLGMAPGGYWVMQRMFRGAGAAEA